MGTGCGTWVQAAPAHRRPPQQESGCAEHRASHVAKDARVAVPKRAQPPTGTAGAADRSAFMAQRAERYDRAACPARRAPACRPGKGAAASGWDGRRMRAVRRPAARTRGPFDLQPACIGPPGRRRRIRLPGSVPHQRHPALRKGAPGARVRPVASPQACLASAVAMRAPVLEMRARPVSGTHESQMPRCPARSGHAARRRRWSLARPFFAPAAACDPPGLQGGPARRCSSAVVYRSVQE